jgi:ABC-type multidrug transport system fused ATPase/permease subunit
MKPFRDVLALLTNREKTLVSVSLVIRFGLVLLDIGGIFLVGVVVSLLSGTVISTTSPLYKFLAWLDSISISNGYAIIAVIAVGFFIVKGLLAVLVNRLTASYVARIESRKASDLFRKMLNSNLDRLDEFKLQEISHGLNTGVNSAIAQVINVGSAMFGEVVLLLAISIYLAFTNVVLFVLVALFFTAVGIGMQLIVGKAAGISGYRAQVASLTAQGEVLSVLDNFRQIATIGKRNIFLNRFDIARRDSAIESAVYSTITTLPRYITEIAVMVGAGLLVLQRTSSNIGNVSAPVIAVFLAGLFRIVSSMLPLQSGLTSLQRYAQEAMFTHRMNARLQITDQSAPYIESVALETAPTITLERLSFRYPTSKRDIIHDLSLQIASGDYVAIIGKSGLGKSTLVDLILGLRSPSSGSVSIGNQNPRAFHLTRAGICGFVPQQVALFEGTLLENITLEADDSKVNFENLAQVLKMTHLESLVDELSAGIYSEIGKSKRDLSGGQIQRIGLARALYSGPKLLVLDEVTSALDPETEAVIDEALASLRGKVTCLVIAHKPGSISKANSIIRFRDAGVEIVKNPLKP